MIISDVLVELADFKNKNSQGFQAKRENHLQSQKNKLSDFKKKKNQTSQKITNKARQHWSSIFQNLKERKGEPRIL